MLVAFRDQECDSDALAMLLQSSEHHELTGAVLFVGYMMPAYSIAKCLRFATSPTLPICGPMKSWHPSGDSSGSFFNFFLFHYIIQSLFKRTWQCSSIFAHLLKAGSPFTIHHIHILGRSRVSFWLVHPEDAAAYEHQIASITWALSHPATLGTEN